MEKILKRAIVNALATVAYIVLIASLMFFFGEEFCGSGRYGDYYCLGAFAFCMFCCNYRILGSWKAGYDVYRREKEGCSSTAWIYTRDFGSYNCGGVYFVAGLWLI
jgi:hypothetical protein